MLQLENECESSFATRYVRQCYVENECPFCPRIEGDDDEYEIISAVITQDEETHTDYPCRGVGLDTQYTR